MNFTRAARRRRSAWVTLASSALVAAGARHALAASALFTGSGDGVNWSDARNWTSGGKPGVAPSNTAPGDDLLFAPAASLQVNLDTSRVGNSLNFNSGATTLDAPGSSNTLTLTTGNLIFDPLYADSGEADAIINSRLVSNSLTVTAVQAPVSEFFIGQLTLNNAGNSFTGGLALNNSTVNVQSIGALGGGPMTLNGGTLNLNFSSGTISQPIVFTGNPSTLGTVLPGQTLTLSGPISGDGAAQLGSLLNSGAGTLVLSGSAPVTCTEEVDFSEENVMLDKPAGVLATGTGTVYVAHASVKLLADNQTSASNNLVLLLDDVFNLNGHATTIGSLTDEGSNSGASDQILLGSGTLTVGANGEPSEFFGSISGTGGSLVKTGASELTLSGTNTFTGSLTISGGLLQAGGGKSLGNPSMITVVSPGTLDLNGQSLGSSPMTLSGAGAGNAGALINSTLTPAAVSGAARLAGNTTFAGFGNISIGGLVSGPGGLLQIGTNTLTLSAGGSFTGGLTVDSGVVAIPAASTYSGGISLAGGTLSIKADSGLGAAANAVHFSSGGNLLMNGLFTTSRSFVSTGGEVTVSPGSTVTDTGSLSGSGSFEITGGGTLRLKSANPFTGSILITDGSTLSLAGPAGALGSISGIDLQTTGTLALNSSSSLGGNQSSQNRISNSAPITLDGGTIVLDGADNSATSESLGQLIPRFGASTIQLNDGSGTSSSTTLTFASLGGSSAGATIGFDGSDLGNTQKVLFGSGVANGTVFGGGITVNGTDFAKYSSTQGVIPFARSDYTVNVFSPGANVKLDPAVTAPPVPSSVNSVSIKTLNIDADVAPVAVNQNTRTTLTLTNGGLIKSGDDAASISGGTLTSSSGELDISVQGGPLSISSQLAGSFVLTKRGSGTLALIGNAASTYSGFTLVSGEMDLDKTGGALAIPGNLIVDGGLLKSLASNQIATSASVTLNYGAWDLNGQTETISKLNNSTGTLLFHGGHLTVNNGVTLAGGTTTVASVLTSNALLAIGGGDNEVHADGVITTNALAFYGASPSIQLYSDNTMPGELNLSAGANVSFTGTGVAQVASIGTAADSGVINLLGSSSHTFTVNPGSTMAISASIANGAFTVQGGGTMLLSGTSSYTLNGVTVGAGTTLQLNNDLLDCNVNFAGGTLAIRGDGAMTELSGSLNALPSSSISLSLGTLTPGITAGTFSASEVQAYSGTSFTATGAGVLQVSDIALSKGTNTGAWTIHNQVNMTVQDGINLTAGTPYTSPLIDIIKDQAGTLILQGSASNYGNMTVAGGTLELDQYQNFAIPHNLLISGASTVRLDQSSEIAPTSAITLNAATGNSLLDLNNYSNTISSLSFVAGGTMNTGAGVATVSSSVNFSGTSGTAVINGNLDLGKASPTFNISGNSTNVDLKVTATLSGDSNSAGINKIGSGVLYLAGNNSFTGLIAVSAGTVKVDQSVAGAVTVKPGGVFDLDAASTSGILVRNLSSISFTTGSAPFGQLNVLAASQTASRQLVVLKGLTVAGTTNAWQGKIDLANNDLDVAAGSLANLTNMVKQGYNAGKWNGSAGVVSTVAAADTRHLTAIGVIQNNQSGAALFTSSNKFDGTVPGASDILLKYTYYGDTNFDGKVDATDLARLNASISNNANPRNKPLTGWYNGDFNYDGVINGSDMTLLDNAMNAKAAQLNAIIAAPQALPTAQIAGTTSVPEPTGAGLIGVCCSAILTRRRKRINR
jgi:autotransporter-associated beta strand protein